MSRHLQSTVGRVTANEQFLKSSFTFYQILKSQLYGFTISAPVLILPIFLQFLLWNREISSKSLFWNKRTQCAGSKRQQKRYFNSIIISNQIKYYLAIKRGNSADTLWFNSHALQIHYSAMMVCYLKSMYQELEKVNAWNVTVWTIIVKGH